MTDSPRSLWGWGNEDAALRPEEVDSLGEQVRFLLGGVDLEKREPPVFSVAAGRLAAPEIVVPPTLPSVQADPRDRMLHTYGRSFGDIVRALDADFASAPDLVAHPKSASEVEQILDWAGDANVAVVPFGGGTSVVGGVECSRAGRAGVLSLDMSAMNRVLEVDPVSLAARIQAGARGPVLEQQLRAHGLSLRFFPQSFEFSTLGGWLATRAGGHHATLYTHIDDLVESISMITPAGPWASARLPASGAGPSPDRMVLGSEGALGVITEAWMRVVRRPVFRSRATVHFASFEQAVDSVRTIAQARLYPSNCRLLDRTEALINQVAMGSHVLLLGFESAHGPMQTGLADCIAICQQNGGTVADGPHHTESRDPEKGSPTGAGGGERWRASFVRAPYLHSALCTLGLVVDTFETSCTWDRFEALDASIRQAVQSTMAEVCGGGVLTCRFTHVYPDGPAPYYTFLAPGKWDGRLEQWAAIKTAASEAIARNGGSITHHHAVGRMHRPWYQQQRPALFGATLRAAKSVLDPQGILNPGVLLDG